MRTDLRSTPGKRMDLHVKQSPRQKLARQPQGGVEMNVSQDLLVAVSGGNEESRPEIRVVSPTKTQRAAVPQPI